MTQHDTSRLWYRNAYYTRTKDSSRAPLPFQLRDADSALCLTPVLSRLGYTEFGGIIYNFPLEERPPRLILVDHRFLGPDRLVLTTTRPPMDDHELDELKGMERSYTVLEEKLFAPLRRWFAHLSRSEIKLTEEAAAISPRIAEHRFMQFRQHCGALYDSYGADAGELRTIPTDAGLTAAFLVHEKHAWPGGPELLTIFGPGGLETLGWTRLLATRYGHLVGTVPFVMAELRMTQVPERPHDLSFLDTWTVDILN